MSDYDSTTRSFNWFHQQQLPATTPWRYPSPFVLSSCSQDHGRTNALDSSSSNATDTDFANANNYTENYSDPLSYSTTNPPSWNPLHSSSLTMNHSHLTMTTTTTTSSTTTGYDWKATQSLSSMYSEHHQEEPYSNSGLFLTLDNLNLSSSSTTTTSKNVHMKEDSNLQDHCEPINFLYSEDTERKQMTSATTSTTTTTSPNDRHPPPPPLLIQPTGSHYTPSSSSSSSLFEDQNLSSSTNYSEDSLSNLRFNGYLLSNLAKDVLKTSGHTIHSTTSSQPLDSYSNYPWNTTDVMTTTHSNIEMGSLYNPNIQSICMNNNGYGMNGRMEHLHTRNQLPVLEENEIENFLNWIEEILYQSRGQIISANLGSILSSQNSTLYKNVKNIYGGLTPLLGQYPDRFKLSYDPTLNNIIIKSLRKGNAVGTMGMSSSTTASSLNTTSTLMTSMGFVSGGTTSSSTSPSSVASGSGLSSSSTTSASHWNDTGRKGVYGHEQETTTNNENGTHQLGLENRCNMEPVYGDLPSLEVQVANHACHILKDSVGETLKAVELANMLRARVGCEVLARIREKYGGMLILLEQYPAMFNVIRIPKNDSVSLVNGAVVDENLLKLGLHYLSSPNYMENIYRMPSVTNTSASRCLHVGSVASHISEVELRAEFSKYGEIQALNLVCQRGRRFAFVNYSSVNEAEAAKNALCKSPLWRSNISYAKRESSHNPHQYMDPISHRNAYKNKENYMMQNDTKFSIRKPSRHNSPSRHLWVGNLGDITKPEIYNVFRPYGEICSINLLKDRHCAFIEFKRMEDCIQARQGIQGAELGGNEIEVGYGRDTVSKTQSSSLYNTGLPMNGGTQVSLSYDSNDTFEVASLTNVLSATSIDEERGSIDQDVLNELTTDKFILSQGWKKHETKDSAILNLITNVLIANGRNINLTFLRGILKEAIKCEKTIKTVPLKALLEAYSGIFEVKGNTVFTLS